MVTTTAPLAVLIVHDPRDASGTVRAELDRVVKELLAQGLEVVEVPDTGEGSIAVTTRPDLGAVLLGWGEGAAAPAPGSEPVALLGVVRARFDGLPVFLFTEALTVADLPVDVLDQLSGCLWVGEDTPAFVVGRIRHAIDAYRASLLPPFFERLARYVDEYRYSWHTPGHMGGLAFLKSPSGRLFFDFVGENFLRADISSSVPELGSVLEHEGVVGEAEARAARVFGADDTYFVTNGTTMSNQIVFRACVTPGDVVLLDRNCHKSVVNAVIQTGAVPVWLQPVRNRLGLIGPIDPAQLEPAAIEAKLAAHPLLAGRERPPVRLAVVANSTYDGTLYETDRLVRRLGAFTDRVLLDEAWIAYAAFHPLYRGHYGMSPAAPAGAGSPTVVTTMSTHKMLAALSQASMIHIRQGRSPLPRARFNEAYMMHASTSPQYGIIASLDVATQMMAGASGRTLLEEAVEEALELRTELRRIGARLREQGTWWFGTWQPDTPDLAARQEDWQLAPGASWHGFPALEPGGAMLDPVKVTLVCPGVGGDGGPVAPGIPAGLVATFLRHRGVVVEKTGYYSILVLFSIAVTRGKAGTLVTELLDFHRAFEANAPLAEALPEIHDAHADRYAGVGIADLAAEMHAFLSSYDTARMQTAIAAHLPAPAMTPGEAFSRAVRGEVEQVPLAGLDGRVCAATCLLYPPGIPVVVPGERFDPDVHPIVEYLQLFERWDERFPGFETEVQGVVKERATDGSVRFTVSCVVEEDAGAAA